MEHRIHHRRVVIAAIRPSTASISYRTTPSAQMSDDWSGSAAGQLFRGHVGDRADRDAGPRQPGQARASRHRNRES